MDFSRDTLVNLHRVWKRPVHVETKEKAGKPASPSTARSIGKNISINARLNRAHLETLFFPSPRPP